MKRIASGAVSRRVGWVPARFAQVLPGRCGLLVRMSWLVFIAVALTSVGLAEAAKLVAPVYPGAVPAMTGKRADGQPDSCEGRCFLSKDPIEKVKAFYEKKLGALKPAPYPYNQPAYGILLEYANRSEEGSESTAVEMFALSPAIFNAPKDRAKRSDFFRKGGFGWGSALGPLGILVSATDWGEGAPDLAPYKPADVVALYEKYRHLNTVFFVRDAASGKTRADQLSDQFSDRVGKLMQESMTGNLANQMAISSAANQEGGKIAAEEAQDDPEFNRIMQRKPALAKKYGALAQKAQGQMMSQDMDGAEKTMDESDKLLRSDPEMAVLMRKYDDREQRRDAVTSKRKAQGNASEAQSYATMGKKRWDLAVQTLQAMAKETYATYFEIDFTLAGKGIERDRAKLHAMYRGPLNGQRDLTRQAAVYQLIVQEHGIAIAGDTPEQVSAAREAGKSQGVRTGAAAEAKPAAAAKPQAAAATKPPAAPPAAPPAEQPKNEVQEAAKKGLNLLKKLW